MSVEFNTSSHTISYTNYFYILSGNNSYVYNPSIEADIYYITKYLRDNELAEINKNRIRNGIKPIPRLAYIGDGRYMACNSQKQRIEIEKEIFLNNQTNININNINPIKHIN